MSCADDAASALLPHVMVPAVGSLRPAISRSAVDLPHPEGPSSETNSPGRTSRSSPSSAWVPLAKVFDTPRSATTESPAAERGDDDEAGDTGCLSGCRAAGLYLPSCRRKAPGGRRAGALFLLA